MRRRQGYNLIEMTVVITVSGMLLGVLVTLVAVILRAEKAGREQTHRQSTLFRLAEQFRDDVHAAIAVSPAAGDEAGDEAGDRDAAADGNTRPAAWDLALPNGWTVRYAAGPQCVTRTERTGEHIDRRESYSLPADCTFSIDLRDADGGKTVVLRIVPAGGSPQQRLAPPCVEAVLARDRRFDRQ